MNTEKLYRSLSAATDLKITEKSFFKILEDLSEIFQSISTKFENSAIASNDASALFKSFNSNKDSLIAEIQKTIRQDRFSSLARSAHKIESALSLLPISMAANARSEVEVFLECLDNQLHEFNLSTSISLARSAKNLSSTIEQLTSIHLTLLETTAKGLAEEKEHIKLYFPEHITLIEFSNKTSALSAIIEICCKLLDMSVLEGEVEIRKIESGSYFAKLSAHPLVIALATTIITNGAIYILNQLDDSKNIDNLKASTETIENILKIRETLKASNISTNEIDEEIRNSTILITKQLGQLIGNQAEVEINDIIISSNNTYKSLPRARNNKSIEDNSNQ